MNNIPSPSSQRWKRIAGAGATAILLASMAAPVSGAVPHPLAQLTPDVTSIDDAEFGFQPATISGDGAWVVYNVPNDGGIRLQRASGGASTLIDSNGFNAAISDDGRWVAFSKFDDGSFDVFLWDRTSGTSRRLATTSNTSNHASISDDGSVVVWRDNPRNTGDVTVHVWQASSNTVVERAALSGPVPLVSGDGRFIFYVKADAGATRWELANDVEQEIPGSFVAVSDDGNLVASMFFEPGNGAATGVAVHNLQSGTDRVAPTPSEVNRNGPEGVTMSANGGAVFFSTIDGLDPADDDNFVDLYRWRPADGSFDRLGTGLNSLAASDDGSEVVVIGRKGDDSGIEYQVLSIDASQEPGPEAEPEPEPEPDVVPDPVAVADLAGKQLEGQVTRIYRAFFLRPPDADGLQFWMMRRAAGASLVDLANGFVASDEFSDTYGSLSDAEFVELVYQNVFGRPADAGGRAFWTAQLAGGVTRGEMMVGFSESPELVDATSTTAASPASAHQLWRLYRAYFGRNADQGGFDFWYARLANRTSLADVSNSFAGSAEFTATYGSLSDAEFVELVYQNVLGRAADAGGRDFWIGQLSAGVTRGEMMVGFSESPEFITVTNTLPV